MKNDRSIRRNRLSQAMAAALCGFSLAAMLTASPAAHAQVASSAAATDNAPNRPAAKLNAKTLGEVEVTAEKKTETEQNVPISMSVVEAADMLNSGMSSLDDYYAQVPGLSVNDRGSGRTTLVIRGISAGDGLNPTVGVSVDDVPYGSSTTDFAIADLDPFDIDHIEVLRGPQGTLYGASSMGGLIKYVMVQPDTDNFTGTVQQDVSSTYHGGVGNITRVAFNFPLINDVLGLRVSAFHRDDAGYVDDPLQGKTQINQGKADGTRISALWKASDSLTLRASVMAQNDSTDGSARVDMQGDSYIPLYGAYAHERIPGTDTSYVKTRVYTFQVEDVLPWADFHSITSYNNYSLVGPQDVTGEFAGLTEMIYGVDNPGVAIVNNAKTGKFTQEFRLSSPDDGRSLGWLLGGFFTKEHSSAWQQLVPVDQQTGDSLGLPLMYSGLSPSTYKESALFGNVTYAFSHAFDIQVGGRFSAIRQTFDSTQAGILQGDTETTQAGARNNVWTYSVSPRYHLNDNLMTYLRVSTGYRAGGANVLLSGDVGNFPTQYKSDSLTSYEWGLKGDFADHRLTLDTSIFYIDWTHIQLNEVSQVTGASYMVNAGSAKSQGAELTVNWRPVRGLTLSGNAAFTDAVLTSSTPDGSYGVSGDRLPYSPRWSWNLGADYSFPLGGGFDGDLGGGVTYMGDRMSDFAPSAQAQRFDLRAYTTARLHAGVQSDQWNISLYVKNLTNTRGYLSATAEDTTTGVGDHGLLLIQPRTVGLSATYSF